MVINCTAGMECKARENRGCGGSCREVFWCMRFDIRIVTGCVQWWCPILSGCWPEVGLDRFLMSVELDGRVFVDFFLKQSIRDK